MENFFLHLENQAINWENATPVGCGTLGAMLFGGVAQERLQLNEEKIWAVGKKAPEAEGFYERFQDLRAALARGECGDALAKETEERVDMLAERISTAITPVSPTGIAMESIVGTT